MRPGAGIVGAGRLQFREARGVRPKVLRCPNDLRLCGARLTPHADRLTHRKALQDDANLLEGLNVYFHKVTYKAVAEALDYEYLQARQALDWRF